MRLGRRSATAQNGGEGTGRAKSMDKIWSSWIIRSSGGIFCLYGLGFLDLLFWEVMHRYNPPPSSGGRGGRFCILYSFIYILSYHHYFPILYTPPISTKSSLPPPFPPLIQRTLPPLPHIPLTPFLDNPPSPLPYNPLHRLLIPQQAGQLLRPRFPLVVLPRVGI
jgi:hypothetical protein